MSEYFVDPQQCPTHRIFPGVDLRTAWLERLMVSLVEFEPGAVVEEHSHPHEQMGILLEGRLRFTIGEETRTIGPGEIWRIPSNVPHRVVAEDTGARALDVFSPVREDYK